MQGCSFGKEFHEFKIELECMWCNRRAVGTRLYPCKANDIFFITQNSYKSDGVICCAECNGKVRHIYFRCKPGSIDTMDIILVSLGGVDYYIRTKVTTVR